MTAWHGIMTDGASSQQTDAAGDRRRHQPCAQSSAMHTDMYLALCVGIAWLLGVTSEQTLLSHAYTHIHVPGTLRWGSAAARYGIITS